MRKNNQHHLAGLAYAVGPCVTAALACALLSIARSHVSRSGRHGQDVRAAYVQALSPAVSAPFDALPSTVSIRRRRQDMTRSPPRQSSHGAGIKVTHLIIDILTAWPFRRLAKNVEPRRNEAFVKGVRESHAVSRRSCSRRLLIARSIDEAGRSATGPRTAAALSGRRQHHADKNGRPVHAGRRHNMAVPYSPEAPSFLRT